MPKPTLLPEELVAAMKTAAESTLKSGVRAGALRRAATEVPFARLVREAEQAGGFTYGVPSGARPKTGFAFSAEPGREAKLAQLTPEAISGYVAQHGDILAKPGNYLGAWRGPDGWYLDVSTVLPDREAALKAAAAARQQAIYNLGTGETLAVPVVKP